VKRQKVRKVFNIAYFYLFFILLFIAGAIVACMLCLEALISMGNPDWGKESAIFALLIATAVPVLFVIACVLLYILNYFLFEENKTLFRTLLSSGILLGIFDYFFFKKFRDLSVEIDAFCSVLIERYGHLDTIKAWIFIGSFVVLILTGLLQKTYSGKDFFKRYDKVLSTVLVLIVVAMLIFVSVDVGIITYQRLHPKENYAIETILKLSHYLNEQYEVKTPIGGKEL